MDGKGNVQIAEYEFCDRLDACLEDLRGGDRSFPITVPPPPSRIKKAHRKDIYNLVGKKRSAIKTQFVKFSVYQDISFFHYFVLA